MHSKLLENISDCWHCQSQDPFSSSLLVLSLFTFFGLVSPVLVFSISIHSDTRSINMISHLFLKYSVPFTTCFKPISLNSLSDTPLSDPPVLTGLSVNVALPVLPQFCLYVHICLFACILPLSFSKETSITMQ